MKQDAENPDFVLNDDLIGIEGSGELIGGSQREDSYEKLKAAEDGTNNEPPFLPPAVPPAPKHFDIPLQRT